MKPPSAVAADTLMIVGEADVIAPAPAHAEKLKDGLKLRRDVEIIADAAHQCMQEQPAAVNAKIHTFLSSAPPLV